MKANGDRLFDRAIPIPFCGCLVWTGAANPDGYGHLTWERKTRQAHIVAYETTKGPVPSGMELDHLCRVRLCINPDHLEPVTHLENMMRGLVADAARRNLAVSHARRRSMTHCQRGHEIPPERDARGKRVCKICKSMKRKTR